MSSTILINLDQSKILSSARMIERVTSFSQVRFATDWAIGLGLWCHRKGLTTRKTHMKYESSMTYHLKVMANVKVFVGETEKQESQAKTINYAPDLSIWGHNPFQNKPWFLHVCSTGLSKTLWKRKNYSHSVFHFFVELSFSSNLKLLSANSFSLEECKICHL